MRPLTTRTIRRAALLALAAWTLATAPLAAYTIVLKDGSTIQAKRKYEVQGERALITLPNGTQTFVRASQIDVARTEQANKIDYGSNAVVLREQGAAAPAAPQAKDKRLADLITTDQAVPRDLPQARREGGRDSGRLGRTGAGFPDFADLPRKPFASVEAAAELQTFFRSQQVEEVGIYQGTQGDRPLLEISTASEAAVFRALTVSANALLHVRQAHPRVAALELLMITPTRERAGQFVLTPEMAAELVAKKVEVSSFFLEHVQF